MINRSIVSLLFVNVLAGALLISCDKQSVETSPSATISIVPTMNSDFGESNTVHCANVEFLWNAMTKNSDINTSDNPAAQTFNQSTHWKYTMDFSKFILAFGKPGDTYESILSQYKQKYGMDRDDLELQGNSFWGYTDKVVNSKYAEPFNESELKFQDSEVSAFGFSAGPGSVYTKDHFKQQFDILYFDYDGQFIVKLNPANTSDEIVLVMLKQRGTFTVMYDSAKHLIQKGKTNSLNNNLNAEDELIMPEINFKAVRKYTELQGLKFSSQYGAIENFEQGINFNFDRKGVVLEAEVSVYDSVAYPQQPKLLRYDRPFYLYIKEANAPFPYFNLWVSNPSILIKKER